MEGTALTALIAEAIAEGDRRDGWLRIERIGDGWETSIVVDNRRVWITREEYLESALMRLNMRAAAKRP